MYKSLANYDYARNYNCRISESIVGDGVRQVALENRFLRIAVLAGKGTDVSEFLYKPLDIDFMWHSFNGLRSPENTAPGFPCPESTFLDVYEGGWQELFPSIGAPSGYKGGNIGMHGEVCLSVWDYIVELNTQQEIRVKFWTRTLRTPYLLEKWMTLKSGEPVLFIHERVTNAGGEDEQFMWGHHPAFGPIFLDESCELLIGTENSVYPKVIPYNKCELENGRTWNWPTAYDKNGNKLDLSRLRGPSDKRYIEYAVSGLECGRYEIYNHNYGVGFGMEWDIELFPYLWVWEPACGCAGYPWYGRDYACAIEPWSALPDSLDKVVREGRGMRLAPGDSIETDLTACAVVR